MTQSFPKTKPKNNMCHHGIDQNFSRNDMKTEFKHTPAQSYLNIHYYSLKKV